MGGCPHVVVKGFRRPRGGRLVDGLTFDPRTIAADTIRDQDDYGGVRVSVNGRLAAARLHVHVDVNIADPITPAPERVTLPRLLGGEIHIVGYPVEMVLAEKIVTAIQRGTANTRWRDFVDIATLAPTRPPDAGRLDQALRAVARHRLVEPLPPGGRPRRIRRHRPDPVDSMASQERLDDTTPEQFDELLANVIALADPAITGTAGQHGGDPVIRAWSRPRPADPPSPPGA